MKQSTKSPVDFFKNLSGVATGVPVSFLSCFYSGGGDASLLVVDDEVYGSLSEHSHLNWLEHGVFGCHYNPLLRLLLLDFKTVITVI